MAKPKPQVLDSSRELLHLGFHEMLGRRIFLCRNVLRIAAGASVSQEAFGRLVAGRCLSHPNNSDPRSTLAGFSKVNVSRWERGKAAPPLRVIQAIGELVGADPGWIAFGEGSGAPKPGFAASWSAAAGGELVGGTKPHNS